VVLILAFASVNTLLMDEEPLDLSRHRRQAESFDFVPEVVPSEPSEETSITDSATKQATPSSFLPSINILYEAPWFRFPYPCK
jgi:hypothetical protein